MLPKFSPPEIIAMTVLLARVIEAQDRKNEIDEQRRQLAVAYELAEKQRAAAFKSFEAFGFPMTGEKPWDPVREALGPEAWSEGFRMARPLTIEAKTENEKNEEGDTESGEQDEAAPKSLTAPQDGDKTQTIREIVLARLVDAGERGAKAADLRKYIEQTHNQTVHEKTVGMTLYRLSKHGLARRDGRTWFSATPSAETENPGGDTPGAEADVFS